MYNLPPLLSPSHLNHANVCRLQCISIKAYARSLIFPWHGVPSRPALYYPWFIQDMLYPHSDSNHQNLGLTQLLSTMVYFSSRSNHTIITTFDDNIIACVSLYWDRYFILYFKGIHRRYQNLNKLYLINSIYRNWICVMYKLQSENSLPRLKKAWWSFQPIVSQ